MSCGFSTKVRHSAWCGNRFLLQNCRHKHLLSHRLDRKRYVGISETVAWLENIQRTAGFQPRTQVLKHTGELDLCQMFKKVAANAKLTEAGFGKSRSVTLPKW